MTRWGLGRTGWAVVALISALNIYAFLPALSGGTLVVVALWIPVAAFLWVHFLRGVLVVLFGTSETDETGANPEPDA